MKKMFVLFLIMLLLMSTVACTVDKSLQTDSVFLLNAPDDPAIFLAGTPSISEFGEEDHSPADPAMQIEFALADQSLTLELLKSEPDGDTYRSADQTITVRFARNTNELRYLNVAEVIENAPPMSGGEAALTDWIRSFVADFLEEDWTRYSLECKTTMTEVDGDRAVCNDYDGYRIPENPNQTVLFYTFDFIHYIGEFATSDRYTVSFSPSDGFFTIWFCAHEFDDMQKADIDMEKVRASIEDFLAQHLDSDSITLKAYQIQNAMLKYIDGKLYYDCVLELKTSRYTELVEVAVLL